MDKDWVLVYTSVHLHKVELLKQFLETDGIECVILNQQDSSYPSIGSINVLVKNSELSRARKTIEEVGL